MKYRLLAVLPLLLIAAGCGASAPASSTPSTLTGAKIDARPFQTNVLEEAQKNEAYRRVLFTGVRSQLTLMTIPPGGDIGLESHRHVEQLIFIASGQGKAVVNGVETPLAAGDVLVATPNTRHNVVNTGSVSLRIYTVYAPPNHVDGRVHRSKSDAGNDKSDEAFGAAVR
ncbi:MAG TPA: cupin domain-containing protein [Polyangiaceae bacterium]